MDRAAGAQSNLFRVESSAEPCARVAAAAVGPQVNRRERAGRLVGGHQSVPERGDANPRDACRPLRTGKAEHVGDRPLDEREKPVHIGLRCPVGPHPWHVRQMHLSSRDRATPKVVEDRSDRGAPNVEGYHEPPGGHRDYSGAGVGFGTFVLPSDWRRVGTMVSSGMCARLGSFRSIRQASATSSGLSMAAVTSGGGSTGLLSMIGVSTMPGLMVEKRTPLRCSSNPAAAARALMPALLA